MGLSYSKTGNDTNFRNGNIFVYLNTNLEQRTAMYLKSKENKEMLGTKSHILHLFTRRYNKYWIYWKTDIEVDLSGHVHNSPSFLRSAQGIMFTELWMEQIPTCIDRQRLSFIFNSILLRVCIEGSKLFESCV